LYRFVLPVSLVSILILVNVLTTSTSALKKTNQKLKAQISLFFGKVENLKSQLGVNADDESTAAAEKQQQRWNRMWKTTDLTQTNTATSSLFRLLQRQSLSG